LEGKEVEKKRRVTRGRMENTKSEEREERRGKGK
jgi:hypothetical protein